MTMTDIVLTGLLLLFAWNGYRTGFVMQAVRFVGLFAAYWLAKTYSPYATPWLEKGLSGAEAISVSGADGLDGMGVSLPQHLFRSGYGILAFALVFVAGLLCVRVAGRLIDLLVSLPGLSFVNRVFGLAAGVAVGVLMLLVLVNLGAFVPNPTIQTALKGSQIASALLNTGISQMLFAK